MNQALVFDEVCAFYGSSQILHDLSFTAPQGAVTCLLGLNGMGKTTTLRTCLGLVDRQTGRILLNGRTLHGPAYRRAQQGITLVPEDRKVFAGLTVLENLQVAQARPRASSADGFQLRDALALFPRLGERLQQKAGTMSGGEQQMLVVARAMLANPEFMMLDEPTEGLAPDYVAAIKTAIELAKARGIGVILVEQSLALAVAVGDAFHVLSNGQIGHSFTRADVTTNPQCLTALLVVD